MGDMADCRSAIAHGLAASKALNVHICKSIMQLGGVFSDRHTPFAHLLLNLDGLAMANAQPY